MISGCSSCGSGAAEPRHSRAAGFHRSTNTKTDLVVTTSEGDRVTISLQAAQLVSKGALRTAGEDYRYLARTRQAAQSLEATVSVEGRLSEKEVRDIKRLVAGLSHLVRQTDRDDTGGASKTLSKLSSLDSIAQATFRLERRESFPYEAARMGSPKR
jgi:hypothetical protein